MSEPLPHQVIGHIEGEFVWRLHHNGALLAEGVDATLPDATQAAFKAIKAAGLKPAMQSTLHSTVIESRLTPSACYECGKPIEQAKTGRTRFYCGGTCRLRAKRRREKVE